MDSYNGWDNYLDFIQNVPPPPEDLKFFASVPWTNRYLSIDSNHNPVPFYSRFEKADQKTDRFFNKIINTADTVPHLLALIRKDSLAPKAAATLSSRNADVPPQDADFILLLHLSSDLNGFRDICHGGVLSALFDEGLSMCVEGLRQSVSGDKSLLLTAYLNVTYRAPVYTPIILCMKTWVAAKEGRKWHLRGQLVDEKGDVKAEANGLWVSAKAETNL